MGSRAGKNNVDLWSEIIAAEEEDHYHIVGFIHNRQSSLEYLTINGIYDFWNWFDDQNWYLLGRVIGGTVYPGLTSGLLDTEFFKHSSICRDCVFTAPTFSGIAAWATFLLTKEVKGTGAGLTAAALLAMVPSYISRSVAGSYDNEAVAIFALIFTFYLYIKVDHFLWIFIEILLMDCDLYNEPFPDYDYSLSADTEHWIPLLCYFKCDRILLLVTIPLGCTLHMLHL
ncbi:unnamed protein product [Ilex paraguariensis]|uniref:dolichyl-diphosphooligosaccharide--protein glycotransferase n=1 Tax=Ilex paraguariensis TaxID=185542 RepID=A0ABC8S7Q1_9AQUA